MVVEMDATTCTACDGLGGRGHCACCRLPIADCDCDDNHEDLWAPTTWVPCSTCGGTGRDPAKRAMVLATAFSSATSPK